MLGVYSDEMAAADGEPYVLIGTCEGIEHVPALVQEMTLHASEVDPRDCFWSGSSEWHTVVIK